MLKISHGLLKKVNSSDAKADGAGSSPVNSSRYQTLENDNCAHFMHKNMHHNWSFKYIAHCMSKEK